MTRGNSVIRLDYYMTFDGKRVKANSIFFFEIPGKAEVQRGDLNNKG
jgi:hypothetical protein